MRDAATHRQGVSSVYNAYLRVGQDPAFAGRKGDYQALLRPLFMLSFLLDDFPCREQLLWQATRRVYLDTLGGRIPPDQGHMLSPTG